MNPVYRKCLQVLSIQMIAECLCAYLIFTTFLNRIFMNQLKYKILPETAFTSLKVYFKYTALFMIFSFQTTYAQRCGLEDNLIVSSPLSSSPALCANPQVGVVGNNSLFIPYQGDNRDLKEVAVVFHVIQKSSSDPQNFTTADIPYLRSLLDV